MKKFLCTVLLAAIMCTLCACGGDEKAKSADLPAVMAKFNMSSEMYTLTQDDLLDIYGIERADVKQYAARTHSSGLTCDEVVLVEAADKKAAARVKKALDNRYQNKLNETQNYLPEEYAVIKTCKVYEDGNYIAMIVGHQAADWVKIYNESFR